MNQTDQFNVKCGDLTPDFDHEVPYNPSISLRSISFSLDEAREPNKD